MKPILATAGCYQALADDAARPDDDVDDAFRNASLENQFGEPERRQRCQLCRFEHNRVPARERGPELPARNVEREVPGNDQADDSERLPERQVDAACYGDRLAVMLVDRSRVEMEDLRDHADLGACAADRLADVLRFDPRELFGVFFDECREPAQQPGAVGRSDGAPLREGGLRARDGGVRLLDAGCVKLGDRLLRSRIDDGEAHPVHLNTSSLSTEYEGAVGGRSDCVETPSHSRHGV